MWRVKCNNQLAYGPDQDYHKLKQIDEKRTSLEDKKRSAYCWLALTKFPYFFQEQERRQWIKGREMELFQSLQKKKVKKKCSFIVIRKVKVFEGTGSDNIEKTWVVNRDTLEIVASLDDDLHFYTLSQCANKLKTQSPSPPSPQYLFIGTSCNVPARSINLPSSTISSKHLILRRLENPYKNNERAVTTFLLCWRKSGKAGKIGALVEGLTAELVSKIVGFVGYRPGQSARYFLSDNKSKNGSFVYLSGKIILQDNPKLIMSKKQGLNLILLETFLNNQPCPLSERIAQKLSSEPVPQTLQLTHNPQLQQNKDPTLSVILIRIETPSTHKLYTLYSTACPYYLVKNGAYTLAIQKEGSLAGCIGVIECLGGLRWGISMGGKEGGVDTDGEENGRGKRVNRVYGRLDANQLYEVKGEVCVQLANSINLVIHTEMQS